ncbi:MAG: transposase [Fuerstiella sp.]
MTLQKTVIGVRWASRFRIAAARRTSVLRASVARVIVIEPMLERADAGTCRECPLADLCLRKPGKGRQVIHEQHEQQRMAHAEKMATTEAKEIYKTRQHPGERPFAMMIWFFRGDQFLTRRLDRVSQEYNWLSAGFNLHRLLSLIRHSTGPPGPKAIALYPSLSPFLN